MEGDSPERGINCTGAKPASPSNSIRRRITSNVPLEFSISKDTRDEASFRNGWGMQVSILIIEPLTCFRTARQILTVEKRHASIGLGALTHTRRQEHVFTADGCFAGGGHCFGPFQLFSPTLPKFDSDANGIDQIYRQYVSWYLPIRQAAVWSLRKCGTLVNTVRSDLARQLRKVRRRFL